MEDLFDREQQIFDNAVRHLEDIQDGNLYRVEEFETLVKEYGRLLRQLRRFTKISDRTTVDLNASKLDLLDKVHYDGLTGIYNRRFVEDNLQRIINTMTRSGDGTLSILLIDIDFFKKYNDTYGHSAGDDCLKLVAQTLNKSIARKDDFAARYGGEEFIIVLPNTDENGAHVMANRALENIRACGILHEKNNSAGYVTISIGVTTGNVNYVKNSLDYINQADKALYISKQNGRNRYTFMSFEEE